MNEYPGPASVFQPRVGWSQERLPFHHQVLTLKIDIRFMTQEELVCDEALRNP